MHEDNDRSSMTLLVVVSVLVCGQLTLRLGQCGQLSQLLLSQFDAMTVAAGSGKQNQRTFVSPSALFNLICSRSAQHSDDQCTVCHVAAAEAGYMMCISDDDRVSRLHACLSLVYKIC